MVSRENELITLTDGRRVAIGLKSLNSLAKELGLN